MKKLLLILLCVPMIGVGQEDIERYKVYDTTNSYNSLLLDSATGQIWQLQIGLDDDAGQLKVVLSDVKYANTLEHYTQKHNDDMQFWEENYNSKADAIVSAEDKKNYKPMSLEGYLSWHKVAKNGRFKLYPTDNIFNFIMVDVIDGDTYQVQWNTKSKKRFVSRFW